jgi:tape measure domain-containing protein|tara:strand:+ start:1024 stop:3066 length:2043 start_codon:yes stop_codon:yes gene_type:complete
VANDVTLLIKLNDQVSRKLSKINQAAKRLEGVSRKNEKATRDLEAAFQRMGRKGIRSFRDLEANAARFGRRMGGLRGTIGKAAIAFAAFRAAQVGIQRVESERRIKLLGQRFGEYAQLQNAATQAAKKFNLSQTEANEALANAFARLRPLGVSLGDITSTFGGFRTAAVLGGATAAEASAAFTQLAQALGSGALRGDEFRSIAEQAPLVLQAISDETGIAAGDLKEYAAQGLLTSDIVIKALKRIESEGAARLAQALDGPAAKIKAFQNATQDVQVALTESVIPELSKSFVILAGIINDLKPVIQGVGSFAAKVLGGIADTIQRIRDPKKLQSEAVQLKAQGLMKRGRSLRELTGSGMSNLGPDYAAQEAALFAAAAKPVELPKGTTPLATLTKKGKGSTKKSPEQIALEKAEKANEKLILQTQKRLATTADIVRERQQDNRLLEVAVDKGQEFADFTQRVLDLVNQGVPFSEAFELEDANRKLKQQLSDQEKYNQLLEQAGQTIQAGLVQGIQDAITGSKSLGESLSGILKQLGGMFLNVGIGALGQSMGIPGFKPFAQGGYVSGPTRALVGEGGQGEYVIPEGKMRESMARYSRGARGSAVIPETGASGTSGEGGGTAVAAPIDVRFNVERINSVDYVTAEQFQAGLTRAAQQGAAEGERRAMGSLRNSAAVRRRIGV